MFRLAEDHLAAWVDRSDRLPLVLRGARQTGKSWLIQHLGERFEGGVAVANLEREPGLAACFASNDPAAVVALLEASLRRSIVPGRSLLFLDEIQAAPQVLAKLRWFAEELPALHVAAAGSLLDFALADHSFSMPVGRISYGHLEPLTFAEFLRACGEDRLLAAVAACTPAVGVALALHPRLAELARTYALVGGMPAAVADWAEHRSFVRVADLHRDLLQTFRDDFGKYRRGVDTARVATVFAALPRLVGRKFQPSAIDREEKSRSLKDAFRLLSLARVVTPVQRTAANGVPLGAEVDERYQKVCLLDTGLYATMVGLDAAAVTNLADLTLVNEGQLAEQLVGQELRAVRPFNQEPGLFTWVRAAKNSNAEVDYVLQVGTRVVPVEVKAGATGTLRSLHMMVREKGLDLAVRVNSEPLLQSTVTTSLPVGAPHTFRLLSVPFYLVGELPRLVREIDRGGVG